MTDLKTLRQLIRMMVENDLTEVDLQGEDGKIKLKRGPGDAPTVQYAAPPPAQTAPAPAAASASGAPAAPAPPAEESGLITVNSPMVGTFYASSSPDAPAFVRAGDKVSPDTVVCLLEAMKVFNEIKAEAAGTVTEILVSNGDAVEFGQPILKIRPA
ncbi:MAG: acetyl-CoA carboxylase biotin carboxyl carrier protein [Phycisphaeraceae bacterium]